MVKQGLTQKQLRQSQIAELRDSVRRFNAAAELHYKIHPTVESIDYLAVLDPDADLAAALTPSGSPEDRARLFLVSYYALFSFYTAGDQEQRRIFDSNLFLKHTLRSRMGTHCMFSWREGPNESAEEHYYAVHLDPGNRVIMATSIYPDDADFRSQPATWVARRQDDMAKLPKAHEALRRELDKRKAAGERVRKVTYETILYDKGKSRGLRVKLTTSSGDRVLVFDVEGNKIRNYATDVKSGEGPFGLGMVYGPFWSPRGTVQSAPLADLIERPTCQVVLRDLKSEGDLVGRYVAIQDQVTPDLPVQRSLSFLAAPELTSTMFDRQMAYYHIDRIQRYFRDMGLDALDTYEHLNPLQIVLHESIGPLYAPNEQCIYIPALTESGATYARDARILYHEFVHGVTDALARLSRHDDTNVADARYRDTIQAAAMDEGLADYFACSLAVRSGAEQAALIPRMVIRGERLAWLASEVRTLGGSRAKQYAPLPFTPKMIFDDPLPNSADQTDSHVNSIKYKWAEQWGRYLWALRCAFGADVADMLIAHSIFFLSRWATFGQGVQALCVADRVLFGGAHQQDILAIGAESGDWEDEQDLDQALAAIKPTAPLPSSGDIPRPDAYATIPQISVIDQQHAAIDKKMAAA